MLLPCNDGWFYIRAFPHEWPRLTQALGMPELEKDDRFIDMQRRSEHAEELNTIILSQLGGQGKEEIYDKLQKNHITAGYLANVEDLFRSEQYQSHNYFITIDHPSSRPSHLSRGFCYDGRYRLETWASSPFRRAQSGNIRPGIGI